MVQSAQRVEGAAPVKRQCGISGMQVNRGILKAVRGKIQDLFPSLGQPMKSRLTKERENLLFPLFGILFFFLDSVKCSREHFELVLILLPSFSSSSYCCYTKGRRTT